jgi:hypothetical protein
VTDCSIHFAETICLPLHSPLLSTSWPIFAASRGRKRRPAAAEICSFRYFIHSQSEMPRGANSASRANASSDLPDTRSMTLPSRSVPPLL